MPDNQRSRAITQGAERTPNRAMLRAVGFRDGDFDKPIVGVANGFSTITPCNKGLNELATDAERALRNAGAMPQMFGTITVSDGISMGTEGMKYSLVSREVIADSIETAVQAESMDGVISGYRALTGKAPILPKWAYGFWQSRQRYQTQDELLGVVGEYRKRALPLDNIVQDWFYWPENSWGCHCFDPNTNFVLNPKAWTNPAAGQWGNSAGYYDDYRYQRRPSESLSLGRNFPFDEGKMNLQIRADFTNVFNRAEAVNPVSNNAGATQSRNNLGQTTGGFGYINTSSVFAQPRQGTLVARFTF